MDETLKLTNSNKTHKSFVHSLFFGLVFVMTTNELVGIIINLIDTFCVSKFIGDKGIAAIELVGPFFQIISIICQIFAVGGELVFTKLIAKGDKKTATKHLSSNIIFLFLLGTILGMTFFFLATPISNILSIGKVSEETTQLTSQYLRGIIISLPFMLTGQYISSIVYLDNDGKRLSLSIVVTFLVNVILDYLFGYYFTNKAFGIALASSISLTLSTLVLFTHFYSKKTNYKINFKLFKFSHIKDSFSSGFLMGITDIVITIRLYLFNILMITVGSLSKDITGDALIAAAGIESNVSMFFDLGLGGILETILMLGAVFYNEEDESCLNELFKDVVKFTLIVGGSLSIIYFFTAPYIAELYTDDPIVKDHAIVAMRVYSIANVIMSLATSFLTFLQVSKKDRLAKISTILQSLIFPIIFLYVFGFTFGAYGIWMGLPTGIVTYFLIYLTIAFIKNKKIKFDVRTLFYLPKDFGYSKDEIYEKEINNIVDTYSLQKDVLSFCNKFNIDERRKQNLSNAAEELGALIVISGFTRKSNKKQKPHASIKVLYKKKDDKLIIRTRDNCDKFDITEKIQALKEGTNLDPALHCSLKILLNISKDIDYSQLLKTNNMIIKL